MNIWPKHHTLVHINAALLLRTNKFLYVFSGLKKAFETKIGRVLNAAKMAICTCPVMVVDVKLYFYVKQMDALRNFCRPPLPAFPAADVAENSLFYCGLWFIYERRVKLHLENEPNQSVAACACYAFQCRGATAIVFAFHSNKGCDWVQVMSRKIEFDSQKEKRPKKPYKQENQKSKHVESIQRASAKVHLCTWCCSKHMFQ